MKIIYRHSSTASIWADEYQFALRIKSRATDHDRHDAYSYFPTFAYCLEELLTHVLKKNLNDACTNDLQELIAVVKATYDGLKNKIPTSLLNQPLQNGKSWETTLDPHNSPKL